MDIKNRTVMILGGSGLVGLSVARRMLSHAPRRIVLVALREDEVEAGRAKLEPIRGSTEIDVAFGNVFLADELARMSPTEALGDDAIRKRMVDDIIGPLDEDVLERSFLFRLFQKYQPDAVVDCINTATAFAYQNVFSSAADMLVRARAGESLDTEAVERHVLTIPLPQLIRHVQILLESMSRFSTAAYAKIGTSGTGGMGLNIPYTHSEEKPSRMLLAKSAVAGAHSMLLFLAARTPGGPGVSEIKPTATIGWQELAYGPIRRAGKDFKRYECESPVEVARAFEDGAECWKDTGELLQSVYAHMGENGVFAREEFETVTSLGSMELITPEEVADYVVMEITGRPTGKDIVAALDGASAGPTYKAGILRQAAINRLADLEAEHGVESIGFEMLGPPRLTKLLYEAHILSKLKGSVEQLAKSDPKELAAAAQQLVAGDSNLRQCMISVGIPVVIDGPKVYRGAVVMVQMNGEELEDTIPRGWVDLRSDNMATWVDRANRVLALERDRQKSLNGGGSGSDVEWGAMTSVDAIKPSRFATWIFRYEDDGERIKR